MLLAVPLAAVAAVAHGSVGDNVAPCVGRLSCGGGRLPGVIVVAAADGRAAVSYRIDRDGRVRRIARRPSRLPPGAALFPASGTWFMIRHHHLVVGRGGTPLWRSHREMARNQLGVIMATSHMVAFQHDHKLYIATPGSAERPVANREMPLGWTRDGLYTYAYQGRRLLLRSDTGTLLTTIARRPFGSDYFVADGSLYFIVHGILMAARGARTQRLASLAGLGMADAWMQPVGGSRLVELQDNRRLEVLRPDGSVFASTPLPRAGRRSESISSALVAAPDASAVAFTGASGETTDPVAVRTHARHRDRLSAASWCPHRHPGAHRARRVQGLRAGGEPRVARQLAALRQLRGQPRRDRHHRPSHRD